MEISTRWAPIDTGSPLQAQLAQPFSEWILSRFYTGGQVSSLIFFFFVITALFDIVAHAGASALLDVLCYNTSSGAMAECMHDARGRVAPEFGVHIFSP